MASRGWYAEKRDKLRKYQIMEMEERLALEVIGNMKSGTIRPTHEQEQEACRNAIVNITLRKLGVEFAFMNS